MNIDYTYIYLSRINEIPVMVNGVLGIVEKHDPETLGVKPLFDLVVEQQPQLMLLTEPRSKHPLSPIIYDDTKRLKELAQAIDIQAKAVAKGKIPAKTDAAFEITPLIKKYLAKIAKNNSISVVNSVSSFVDLLTDKNLKTAATTIGISEYVDEISLVKNRLLLNSKIRNAENSARRITKEKKLKPTILNALTNLLKAIDLAQVHNTTVDYTSLIAEINQILVSK